MISKQTRWLWSYDAEKTEEWLSDMANRGHYLYSFNRLNRVFSFGEGERKHVTYQIVLKRDSEELSETLKEAGWQIAAEDGKWQVLINEQEQIPVFPSRNPLVKRMRRHAYTAFALATFQIAAQVPILMISLFLINIKSSEFVGQGQWVLYAILLEALLMGGFAWWLFRKYRAFEVKEMDMMIDRAASGKKVRKFRPGWMYNPTSTQKWLENLAREGLELDSVYAAVFSFRKIHAKKIRYQCTFEFNVQPSYFETHKELGWQLKYTSNMTWLNYAIWAKEYEGEEVPEFSYNRAEQRQSVKRAFYMNTTMGLFLLLFLGNSLFLNLSTYSGSFFEWSFDGVMRILLSSFFAMWFLIVVRIFAGHYQNMKKLKEE